MGYPYSTQKADIRLVEAVRRSEDGKGRVTFTPDEISMIHQFADRGRAGTTAMLRAILLQIKDGQTRQIVEQTRWNVCRRVIARKLSRQQKRVWRWKMSEEYNNDLQV